MGYKYVIRTSIPRSYLDDEIGFTLDSCIETCKNYVGHNIPFHNDPIKIHVTLTCPVNEAHKEWIRSQLNDNFGDDGEAVLEILKG